MGWWFGRKSAPADASVVIAGQQVIGSRASAIGSASGGTTVDVQARAVIDQILTAMRQHGLIEP